jgi:tetratricopeptide (TPR) repeat protein
VRFPLRSQALFLSLALFTVTASLACAQSVAASKPMQLVTSFGPGAISLPRGEEWKPELITVYDKGARPAAQFTNSNTHVNVSYILFENRSGKPNAEGCREDAVSPIVSEQAIAIRKRTDSSQTLADGTRLATTLLIVDISAAASAAGLSKREAGTQNSLFAFAGDEHTCAELHASTIGELPERLKAMAEVVSDFHPVLGYKPSAIDYFRIAQILFKNAPVLAAPYYKSSLDTMPADAGYLTARRITTDQLVMALGMSGDLRGSRAIAEKAIASDPDYPINYYNLACADAEKGDAISARTHLQQAFDRRNNVIKGESMPDPAQDDSILKLKKNKEFWAFVTSLPKS